MQSEKAPAIFFKLKKRYHMRNQTDVHTLNIGSVHEIINKRIRMK